MRQQKIEKQRCAHKKSTPSSKNCVNSFILSRPNLNRSCVQFDFTYLYLRVVCMTSDGFVIRLDYLIFSAGPIYLQ